MAGIQGFNSFNQNVGGVGQNRSAGGAKKAESEVVITDGVSLGRGAAANEVYDPLTNSCLSSALETINNVVGDLAGGTFNEAPKADKSLVGPLAGAVVGSGIYSANSGMGSLGLITETSWSATLDAPKGVTDGVHMNSILSTEIFGLSGRKLA